MGTARDIDDAARGQQRIVAGHPDAAAVKAQRRGEGRGESRPIVSKDTCGIEHGARPESDESAAGMRRRQLALVFREASDDRDFPRREIQRLQCDGARRGRDGPVHPDIGPGQLHRAAGGRAQGDLVRHSDAATVVPDSEGSEAVGAGESGIEPDKASPAVFRKARGCARSKDEVRGIGEGGGDRIVQDIRAAEEKRQGTARRELADIRRGPQLARSGYRGAREPTAQFHGGCGEIHAAGVGRLRPSGIDAGTDGGDRMGPALRDAPAWVGLIHGAAVDACVDPLRDGVSHVHEMPVRPELGGTHKASGVGDVPGVRMNCRARLHDQRATGAQ